MFSWSQNDDQGLQKILRHSLFWHNSLYYYTKNIIHTPFEVLCR